MVRHDNRAFEQLAAALEKNGTLTTLDLEFNQIRNSFFTVALASTEKLTALLAEITSRCMQWTLATRLSRRAFA